jgi:hypothetical protein
MIIINCYNCIFIKCNYCYLSVTTVTIAYLIWSNQPEKIKFMLINDKTASLERGTQRSAGYDLK